MRSTHLVLISVTTFALSVAPPADLPVSAAPMTTVHVAGEVSGFLPAPCNCTTDLVIEINARGSDDSVDGTATTTPVRGALGATNVFEVSGSVSGSDVLLSGTIIQSTVPLIVGSPVEIEADATTGDVHVTLGPLTGGVFVGQTLQFVGSGRVIITGN